MRLTNIKEIHATTVYSMKEDMKKKKEKKKKILGCITI